MQSLKLPLRYITSLTLLTVLCLVSIAPAGSASALSGSQFNAGDIIDDSVFFNSSSMSANDIQAFLNSKVPTCDTNGTQIYSGSQTRAQYSATRGYSPPFTCLKDYVTSVPATAASAGNCAAIGGGNLSSAQIIYTVSQACGINPQVLITLLQKEQTLVTDDWPWPIQYQSATGYGCPDTAACNSAYYGLFNQIYNAARAFKSYGNNPTSYNYRAGRSNNILYNPSSSCGSSSIYVQNQPTADLYIYTPYQPNQAALNNLYGSGDSCSAYGNRNFWRQFSDWFGPSVGPLVRTADSGDLYYSDGQTKYHVTSMDLAAQYGLGLSSVRIISQSSMDSLTLSASSPYLTYIVKSTSDSDADGGNIYLITQGRRYLIPSMTILADYGFTTSQISYLDYSQLLRLPLSGTLTNFTKSSYGGYVFKVQNGSKSGILDLATLTAQNPSGTVQDIGDYILDQIPTGKAIINGPLALKDPGGGIWLVADSIWHYVSSMTTYNCLGLETLGTITYSTYQTTVGTQGADAGCAVQTTSGNKYILDGWRRIPVDPGWGLTSLFSVPDSLANRLTPYNPTTKPVFRSSSNTSPLYILSGGKKRQIYSMSSFAERGFVANDLFTTSTDFLSTIPTGTTAFANGSILRDYTSGKLYVNSVDGIYYIPSMTLFNSYGFNAGSIIDVSAVDIAAYTNLGTLSSQLAYTPAATVFDSGIALQIPQVLESAYGFSNGLQPTYPAAIASSGSVRQATRYVKFSNSATLYYMENGTKRPVYSWDTFVTLGGSNNNITGLSASAANLFPTGANM